MGNDRMTFGVGDAGDTIKAVGHPWVDEHTPLNRVDLWHSCGEKLRDRTISEVAQVLYCEGCGFRFVFSREVATVGRLRALFAPSPAVPAPEPPPPEPAPPFAMVSLQAVLDLLRFEAERIKGYAGSQALRRMADHVADAAKAGCLLTPPRSASMQYEVAKQEWSALHTELRRLCSKYGTAMELRLTDPGNPNNKGPVLTELLRRRDEVRDV